MQYGAVSKVIRDGLTSKLEKKKTITGNMSNVKKPKTRWYRIKKWLILKKSNLLNATLRSHTLEETF